MAFGVCFYANFCTNVGAAPDGCTLAVCFQRLPSSSNWLLKCSLSGKAPGQVRNESALPAASARRLGLGSKGLVGAGFWAAETP